jgi:hypothetical protein
MRADLPPGSRAWKLAGAFTLLACAARTGGSANEPDESGTLQPSPAGVGRFLPLEHDTVFTYKVWIPESPAPERLILQVDRRSTERADLRSGNSIKRIEFLPDGARPSRAVTCSRRRSSSAQSGQGLPGSCASRR